MRTPLLLPLLLLPNLVAALPAQALYSPANLGTLEANYDNSLPFGFGAATQSYLQIHADLKGRPGTFTRISFRRDGMLATNAAYAAKTFTADVYFGGGVDIAAMTTTFAANYVTPRTQVASGRTYSIPDWSNQPTLPPAAFDLLCPLDAPYVWDGVNPFVFEMRVLGMSSTHPMFADAERAPTQNSNSSTGYGSGCLATGKTSPYSASSLLTSYLSGTVPTSSFSWSCSRGISASPTAILLGVQSASTPVPGLCGNIRVVPLVSLGGAADAAGAFNLQGAVIHNPSQVGVPLYSQCACLDAARSDPIKVTVSGGAQASVPPMPQAVCARLYDAGNATATVGFLDPAGVLLGTVIRLD